MLVISSHTLDPFFSPTIYLHNWELNGKEIAMFGSLVFPSIDAWADTSLYFSLLNDSQKEHWNMKIKPNNLDAWSKKLFILS